MFYFFIFNTIWLGLQKSKGLHSHCAEHNTIDVQIVRIILVLTGWWVYFILIESRTKGPKKKCKNKKFEFQIRGENILLHKQNSRKQ